MSKTGIDFVIGGKNNATPAIDRVDKQLGKLNRTSSKLERTTRMLKMATGAMMATWAAVKGIGAALGGINAINAAYDQQVEAVKGLEDSLRLNGEEVDKNSAKFQKFAAGMQKLTGVGDEVTLGLMKQASMLGVNADQLEATSKAAIGLSEATDKSLEASLEAVRRAQEGNFQAFERSFPQMRAMQSDAEKLAFVSQLAAKGLDAKASSADRVSGMSERASGAMGDLLESVGALLAPVRMLWNQGIKVLAESIQVSLVPSVTVAEASMNSLGTMMDSVRTRVVGAVTAVELVGTSLSSVFEMVAASVELQLLRINGMIMHHYTVRIPGYASWFAENFLNIVQDAFLGYVAIVKNSMLNAGNMVIAGWKWITEGMAGGLDGLLSEVGAAASRSLLEGFEAATTTMPEIMDRQISEREQQLQDRLANLGGVLAESFSERFDKKMEMLGSDALDELDKNVALTINEKAKDIADFAKLDLSSKSFGSGGSAALSASESRLLTRGPADRREDLLGSIARGIGDLLRTARQAEAESTKTREATEDVGETIDGKGTIMFAEIT